MLALWTVVVWGGRIRNAVADDAGAGALVVPAVFLLLAAAVLATRGWNGFWVVALGSWTMAVWLVRAVDITFLSDHPGAFKAVHLVLAVISWSLAAWAERELWSARSSTG